MINQNIVVTPDNPKASDCQGKTPILYLTIAEVLEHVESLDKIFGKDNWSAYQTVRLYLGKLTKPL